MTLDEIIARDRRDHELLARVRAHPHAAAVRQLMLDDVDTWSGWAETGAESYAGEADERIALLTDLVALLLSPGDAGRGDGGGDAR